MAVMGASMLISYERAKAEALGFNARGGIMERAERLVLLGFGLLFDSLLVPVLWLMLLLTLVTAVQRFQMVWRQASAARSRAALGSLEAAPGRHAPRRARGAPGPPAPPLNVAGPASRTRTT
jgi:CDP-diacylglycerol--glycerol-3-phosphate 3-phosphatidyltransferase